MNKPRNTIQLGTGLYPFSQQELDYFEFSGYAIENVYGRLTEAQKRDIIALWMRNQSLPNEGIARQRVAQVCYLMTDLNSGSVIGVNTLYSGQMKVLQPRARMLSVWMNRMFIDPAFRDSRLMITVTAMTLCMAKSRLSNTGHQGVINANENRKLHRRGMHKIFSRLGYQFLGRQANSEIWFFDFSQWDFADRQT